MQRTLFQGERNLSVPLQSAEQLISHERILKINPTLLSLPLQQCLLLHHHHRRRRLLRLPCVTLHQRDRLSFVKVLHRKVVLFIDSIS